MQCKTRILLRFCGFFEAVADGRAQAVVWRKWAEDDGNVTLVEFAETSEERVGECGVVIEGVPVKYLDMTVVDGPVLRKHHADFFFFGEESGELVVEFGFVVHEDEAGMRGVVADADPG